MFVEKFWISTRACGWAAWVAGCRGSCRSFRSGSARVDRADVTNFPLRRFDGLIGNVGRRPLDVLALGLHLLGIDVVNLLLIHIYEHVALPQAHQQHAAFFTVIDIPGCGASSLKRTIANCTGFQTAFSPLYIDAAAIAEIRAAKMQEVARRMCFFSVDSQSCRREHLGR